MLNAQAAALSDALVAAGIAPDAATRIAKILGNPNQAIYHNGPQKIDVTPQAMRKITPDVRKHQLRNVDFREADPDYRAPVLRTTEEARVPVPAAGIREPEVPAQQDPSTFRVESGQYVSASSTGETVKVGLKVAGSGRTVFFDSPANTLVGKTLRAENDASDNGRLRFYIDETGQEVVWRLQLQNVEDYEVVTGVEFKEGQGLEVTYSTVQLWKSGEPEKELIRTSRQQVIEDIDEVTDDDGKTKMVVQRAVFDAFGADSADGFELVTSAVKLCNTGASAWEKGAVRQLQVYQTGDPGSEGPTDEYLDDCVNHLEYVPAGRFVAVAMASNKRWYLIGRERAQCIRDEKHDLQGDEIAETGYDTYATVADMLPADAGSPAAALLDDGCVRWFGLHKVQFVTNVEFNGTTLVAYRDEAWVLRSADAASVTPTEIPASSVAVLTNAELTSSGLEFERSTLVTLSATATSPVVIETDQCDGSPGGGE